MDSLLSIGELVFEYIEAIFKGLLEEFDSFVVFLTSRTEPYSASEIEALFMVDEERIKK